MRNIRTKRTVPVLFIMADTKSSPILGLPTCKKLNLIKRVLMVEQFDNFQDVPQEIHEVCEIDTSYQELIDKYSDCFGEFGCLPPWSEMAS